MKYKKLYDNHSMAYALAKQLSQQTKVTEDKELAFYTVNLLGVCLSQGHVCADLKFYAGTQALIDFDIDACMPDLDRWSDWLSQQSYVSSSVDGMNYSEVEKQESALLELHGTRLYLKKYANWEQRLSAQLLERSRQEKTIDGFSETSDENNNSFIDWQAVAIRNSLFSPLSIIVGGPGTGKTTTVANILVKLLEVEGREDYRIALAAPTGNAAARMALALNEKLESENVSEELLAIIPQQAVTLHRLLAWSQSRRHFLYNRQRQLALDCVIIDEASMIDLSMFVALTEALPDDCRLILLGDPFQLSSVQAGNVLSEICAPDALSLFTNKRAKQLSIKLAAKLDVDLPALTNNITYLQKSYRFSDEAGIGLLAKACQEGNTEKLEHALQQPEVSFFNKQKTDEREQLVVLAHQHYEKIKSANSIDDAFSVQGQFQLLCAIKKGDDSIHYYNSSLQQRIPWQHSIHGEPIYHAMPIMMIVNHHNLGLYNGDIGLVWQEEGQLWLIFKTAEGELKRFLPSQIQGWQCAHAITVHKSQGSEYNEVALALPDSESPLLTREMFYTAITRAKQHFTCLGTLYELQKAIDNPTIRHSGLREALES